jgi:hypothetical protein
MATVNLGAIKFNFRGAYNNATAYVADDVVTSSGSSYVCILASTGNAVSNGTYWSLMAQAGTDGTDGTDVGLGSAGQVLQTNSGATATEWATPAAGGSWTLIGTAVASNSASLTITGLTSTYDSYRFQWNDCVAASAGADLVMRFGTSAGIQSGADYNWHTQNCKSDSSAYNASYDATDNSIKIADAVNSNTYGSTGSGTIAQGFDGARACTVSGYGSTRTTGAEQVGGAFMGGYKSLITVTQVQIALSTGLLVSGRFTVWGVSHT